DENVVTNVMSMEDIRRLVKGQGRTTINSKWKGIGPIVIEGMTVKERKAFDKESRKLRRDGDDPAFSERLLIQCVKLPDGRKLFEDWKPGDFEDVSGQAERIAAICAKASGYMDDDDEEDDEGN